MKREKEKFICFSSAGDIYLFFSFKFMVSEKSCQREYETSSVLLRNNRPPLYRL